MRSCLTRRLALPHTPPLSDVTLNGVVVRRDFSQISPRWKKMLRAVIIAKTTPTPAACSNQDESLVKSVYSLREMTGR